MHQILDCAEGLLLAAPFDQLVLAVSGGESRWNKLAKAEQAGAAGWLVLPRNGGELQTSAPVNPVDHFRRRLPTSPAFLEQRVAKRIYAIIFPPSRSKSAQAITPPQQPQQPAIQRLPRNFFHELYAENNTSPYSIRLRLAAPLGKTPNAP